MADVLTDTSMLPQSDQQEMAAYLMTLPARSTSVATDIPPVAIL